MNYYKALVQYDGTNYFGFQWQKDLATIQNDFNQAMNRLVGGKITTMGASRTDTGVHAIDQVVKITSEVAIDCGSFLRQLNQALPSQIKCLGISSCEGTFRPASHAGSKEYRYLFTNKFQVDDRGQKFIINYPYRLNLDLMRKCCDKISGSHDFQNFCSTGSNVKSTIRNITLSELTEVDPHEVLARSDLFVLPPDLRHCYQFRIISSGFLKQMVRHLMSAMWLVGSGKITLEEFEFLLEGQRLSKRLWKVAPPSGLYLYRILQVATSPNP